MRQCPACGGALAPWRRAPAAEPAAGETFALSRCRTCGTAVTEGEPAPGLHEGGAYRPGAPRLSRAAAPALRAFDRARLGLLREAAPPPARLLDVGAGRGRFVATALAEGYDARGIEPSERGVRAAAEVYGVTLERAGIEDAAIAPGSLDAVTLWHVLEHVEDPGAALRRVSAWLRPGGAVLVGVPNLASLQARLGGPRWYHLDLPRHRTHFTASGLVTLLERSGFAVDAVERRLLEHNPFGLWQSAVSRMTPTPSWLYHALKRNAPLRPADAVPTVLALPLLPLVVACRPTGTVAVRAHAP